MAERMISGLSHSRGTGLTWDQMNALDAERRRLAAEHLARRVEAAAARRSTPVQASAGPAASESNGPASETPPPAQVRGPRVIEVGKALQRRAERGAERDRLARIEQALDAALGAQGNEQSFSLGGR
ncbi:MAG TPA: hypothetical protein VNT31_15230 [Nocardioides sp.]|nr:hypothetical protein [Nocardioides sp.]